MSAIANLIDFCASSGEPTDPRLSQAIAGVLSFIRAQAEIRFFVDGTPHYGHQAATIRLMKRIIDLTLFTGRITVVYADIHRGALGGTPEKLAMLLPLLDPRRINEAVVPYGTCKHISFVDYDDRAKLSQRITFGFSGAADDMTINLAVELNVCAFLRLQPYLWEDDPSSSHERFYVTSRIETRENQFICLNEENPVFRHLPVVSLPATRESVPEWEWDWYENGQTFDRGLSVRTRNARAVSRGVEENSKLRLWTIYGLHHFRTRAPDLMLGLIGTLTLVQQACPRATVLLLFSSPADIPEIASLLGCVSVATDEDVLEDASSCARLFSPLETRISKSNRPGVHPAARALIELKKSGLQPGKLVILKGQDDRGEAIDIAEQLTRTLAEADRNDIVICLLGPVPADIYDYLLAHSGIPALFEGANTASTVLSLGKPFLRLMRSSSGERPLYPDALGGRDWSRAAEAARSAASQLTDYTLPTDSPGLSRESLLNFLSQLKGSSEFIVETQQASSELSQYFRSVGAYCQLNAHDKCVVGMLALMLSLPDCQAPPE